MFKNILFLSPHRDDECLGAGGTLLQCPKIHIHYFNNIHPAVAIGVYDKEAEAVQERLNCSVSYSDYKAVNRLHMFPICEYINEIEKLINELKPDTVLLPANSYNQDHEVVYKAALTAIRAHDTNWFVPNVLVYEIAEYMKSSDTYVPTVYVPIDIEPKLNLFKLYHSQQRGHRTEDHIRSLAVIRGMQCKEQYAESFMAVRQKCVI